MTSKEKTGLAWLADKIGYVLGMMLGIGIMTTLILFVTWLVIVLVKAIEGS